MAAPIRPVSIKLDEEIKTRVKRLADARDRTSHWLMREAITQYLDREEKREAFRQDTLKAWHDYRKTGLGDDQEVRTATLQALRRIGHQHRSFVPAIVTLQDFDIGKIE